MTVTLLRGDALHLPLADNTVDLVCTSPPYFGLRAYSDNGETYDGQLGSEATPAEFVDALIAATREMIRVLKPSGSLFINLGDKYSGAPSGPPGSSDVMTDREYGRRIGGRRKLTYVVPAKSLIGVPWRYALRCIDDLGLILRAEIIWAKVNGLPESVTDRVRRSHEVWFHFVKQPRYYSAVDEVRERQDPVNVAHHARYRGKYGRADQAQPSGNGHGTNFDTNPLGKLPGSVWTVPTQPLTVPAHIGIDHFAAYPFEFPRRIIRGWSPPGICVACGDGRRPVVDKELRVLHTQSRNRAPWQDLHDDGWRQEGSISGKGRSTVGTNDVTITGYACSCPDTTAPTRPGVVLDPFSGTGTTALVADALGRHGIGIDMSGDYCRLARWRTTDPGERAKAMQVDKPPVEVDGQQDLFGEVAS